MLLDHTPALGLWLDLGCYLEKEGDLKGPWATQLQNRVPESLRVLGGLRNNGDSYPGPRACIQQGAGTSQGTMEIINLDLGSASNRVLRPQGLVHGATLPLTGGHRFYQGITTEV